jgi:hypothetical protein
LLASGRVIAGRLTKKLRLAFKGKSDGPSNFGGPINYAAAHVLLALKQQFAFRCVLEITAHQVCLE